VYRYLGQSIASEASSFDTGANDIDAIRLRYAGRPCLWHLRKLWRPEHAFQTDVHFFGNRRTCIKLKPPLRQAYQLLGQRLKPTLEDYLTYLAELKAHSGANPLVEDEVRRLLHLYRRLGSELCNHTGVVPEFPLLSRQCQLLQPEKVFLGDAPWFEDRINQAAVPLLHINLPVSITHLPWVRSLARAIIEEPKGNWQEIDDPRVRERAERLQTTLRSPEFRKGAARLAAHEYGTCRPRALEWLGQSSVVVVSEVVTDLFLIPDGTPALVGSGISYHYHDSARNMFYLAGEAGKLMRRYLAEMVNAALREYALKDLSGLVEMLDCEPGEIDRTLTQLRIKTLEDDTEPCSWTDEAESDWPDDNDMRIGQAADVADDRRVVDESRVSDSMTRRDEVQEPESAPDGEPAVRKGSGHPTRTGKGSGIYPGEPRLGRSMAGTYEDACESRSPAGQPHNAEPDREAPISAHSSRGGSSPQKHPRAGSAEEPMPSDQQDASRGLAARHIARRPSRQSVANAEDAKHSEVRASEPVRMRAARGRRLPGKRRKDRVATYVSGSLLPDGSVAPAEENEGARRRNIELGQKAVGKVCAFEEEHGRKPTPRGQTHPGYDVDSHDPVVDSLDPQTDSERSIEVKGSAGPWTAQGVALSPRQFQTARELGDRFWLYVVEYADDPERAVVHSIQNPFKKVTEYWFDRGWKQLVDPNEAPSLQGCMETGQRISITNAGDGTIVNITSRGALRVLVVRLDDGRELKRVFNPRTMQVCAPEKGEADRGTYDSVPF
jgi:hypothetical protein